MKAENRAILITYYTMALSQFCVHRGTTVKRFTALWHLTMKSAGGGGRGIETPLCQAEATVT